MTYTTEELILAAHIRDTAMRIRAARMQDMTTAEANDFLQQPFEPLLEEAIERIENVAAFIRARAQHPTTTPDVQSRQIDSTDAPRPKGS